MSRAYIDSIAQALYSAAEGKSKAEIDAIALRASQALAVKRLLKKKTELLDALEEVRLSREKKLKAVVTSKYALSSSELKHIAEYMRSIMKKDIEISNVIDPKLLGGFKVRCGDTILDATLNNAVKQLAHHLTTK